MIFLNQKMYKIKKQAFQLAFVPTEQLITNQVYIGFKKLYDLKPVLEEAGLYSISNNLIQSAIR